MQTSLDMPRGASSFWFDQAHSKVRQRSCGEDREIGYSQNAYNLARAKEPYPITAYNPYLDALWCLGADKVLYFLKQDGSRINVSQEFTYLYDGY